MAMLSWDEATMMPKGGGAARGEALAEITTLVNETLLNPELPSWALAAQNEKLSPGDVASLREMKREIDRVRQVDPELTQSLTRTRFESEQAWRDLRPKNDFKGFLPILKRVVELVREECRQRGRALGLSPYDALAEQYDSGGRSEDYRRVFRQLTEALPGLIDQRRSKQTPFQKPTGLFEIEQQRQLGLQVMQALCYDFDRGRLDVAVHPFCGGVPEDVRITTRYLEDDWTMSLMGVVHETGHASYEQNLPSDYRGLPVGSAGGMSLHESQSLFFEMQMARSSEFLEWLSPIAKKAFGREKDSSFNPENLYRLYTHVEPGLIRVSADELTYPCHIILRFELEQALINGEIECEDLPVLWDQKMKAFLGLSTSGNDRDGVMQDVHWPSAAFGYFPCYTMGAIIAAQLARTIRKALPQAFHKIKKGDFVEIQDWLRKNIWSQGRRYPTAELVERATGETIRADYFLEHLRARYLA